MITDRHKASDAPSACGYQSHAWEAKASHRYQLARIHRKAVSLPTGTVRTKPRPSDRHTCITRVERTLPVVRTRHNRHRIFQKSILLPYRITAWCARLPHIATWRRAVSRITGRLAPFRVYTPIALPRMGTQQGWGFPPTLFVTSWLAWPWPFWRPWPLRPFPTRLYAPLPLPASLWRHHAAW